MVPKASLPSRAPSRASSSRTSGLPSTPSTPGWRREISRCSRSRRRSAMTKGSAPTPSIPRAVWSAATMNSRPSIRSGRRGRDLRRSSAASGRVARCSSSHAHWSSSSSMALPDQVLEIAEGRHVVGAHQPAGDDRSGGVAVARRTRRCPNPTAGRGRARPRRRRRRPARTPPRRGRAATCSRRPSAVATSTPSPPSLTMAACSPRASSRSAASSASVVPTAISHSARLPMASVACPSARTTSREALAGASHSCGRQSRSSTVCSRRPRCDSSSWTVLRLGSADRRRPAPTARAHPSATSTSTSPSSRLRSGALGSR